MIHLIIPVCVCHHESQLIMQVIELPRLSIHKMNFCNLINRWCNHGFAYCSCSFTIKLNLYINLRLQTENSQGSRINFDYTTIWRDSIVDPDAWPDSYSSDQSFRSHRSFHHFLTSSTFCAHPLQNPAISRETNQPGDSGSGKA